MNSPLADAQSQKGTASQAAASQSKCYIATSPMSEVMFDQLEYLLAHSAERAKLGQQCTPECMDCGRLQQVKNWLLMPFHSAMHPPIQ
jgi:hypothetical protein